MTDTVLAITGSATGIIFGFVALTDFNIWVRLWTAATAVLVVLTAFAVKRSRSGAGVSLPGRRQRPLPLGQLIIGLMITTTAVIGTPLLGSAAIGWPLDLKRAAPSAKFEFPPDGEMVESPFLARGTANIPSDHSLWILTRPRNNKYYTNNNTPLIIDPDGEWEYRMGIGEGDKDKNKRFDLFLVCGVAGETEIDDKTQGRSPENTVEFEAFPKGVTILHHVNVTLMVPEG